jgi:hypothetical protein
MNLDSYLYAPPNITERLAKGQFRSEEKHKARMAREIEKFDQAFGGGS